MKISGLLRGLLLLAVSTYGLDDLHIYCSEYLLQVKLRKTPLVDELLPQPYELYLGTGCSVSTVLPEFFEFMYSLSSCGIVKYDRLWGLLIESSITYEPVFLNLRGHIHIACTVQRMGQFFFEQKWVATDSRASGETTQGPLGRKNSTLSQAENLVIHPGAPVGSRFCHVWTA